MKKTENHKVLIGNLTDAQFVNHHIPTTILVTKADSDFTIVEANEEYFKLIGYNKEEVWEVFQNRGYMNVQIMPCIR